MSDTHSRNERTSFSIVGNRYQRQKVDGSLYISIGQDRNEEASPESNVNLKDVDGKDGFPDSPFNIRSMGEIIPETVLQYERQLRKRRAAAKAGAPVTLEQHWRLLYEDDDIVVVDKPSGILCVPGIHDHPSLLTLVHQQYPLDDITQSQRIVHRLDMDTSGVIIWGRTKRAVSKLHKQFRDGEVSKTYEALVCGHVVENAGLVDLHLQRDHERPPFMRVATQDSESAAAKAVQDLQHFGYKKLMRKRPKPSQTEFQVVDREYMSLPDRSKETETAEQPKSPTQLPVTRLSLTPITGRTHQLRVHCAALGHPIVSDPAYGIYGEASPNGGFSEGTMDVMAPNRASIKLQLKIHQAIQDSHGERCMCLHAKTLRLRHPVTSVEMEWEAPVPF